MNNIERILKNMDKESLKRLADSPQGRELAKKLTDEDKKRLLNELSKLSPEVVNKKLNEINKGDLGNAEALIKNLRKFK